VRQREARRIIEQATNAYEGIIMKSYRPGRYEYCQQLVIWVALGIVLAPARSLSNTNLFYGIHKGKVYAQTNDNEPALAQNNAWFFGGEVDPKNSWPVTNAAVVSPLGNTNALYWSGFWEMFATQTYFNGQSALDLAFPAGQYFIEVRGGINQTSPITLPFDDYPAPLRITNLFAAQAIRADADFSLKWNAGDCTNVSDRIRLIVSDSQGHAVWGNRHDDFVSCPTNSVTIPSYALAAGREYSAALAFIHVVWAAHNADPPVDRDASYYALTVIGLRTLPRFVEVGPAANGCVRLRVEASTNYPCILEARADLLSGWFDVSTNDLPTNVFDFYDCLAPDDGPRFYRLKIPQ
jgi:hypothetical protein